MMKYATYQLVEWIMSYISSKWIELWTIFRLYLLLVDKGMAFIELMGLQPPEKGEVSIPQWNVCFGNGL